MWLVVTHHTYLFSIDSVAEKNVDMESLVDDFVTFYVAGKGMTLAVLPRSCDHTSGQETTANTLSFAVILIYQHPEVLDRYAYIHTFM